MAIDTSGYISVAEAARRLGLSTEQVRRKLRDGKLRGLRIGGHWFVDRDALNTDRPNESRSRERLIPREVLEDVERIKRQIAKRNPGYVFDAVEMVRAARDDH